MKIVVFSIHPLTKGIGSKTRIISVVTSLCEQYGSENVNWMNVISLPIRKIFLYYSIKKSLKKYPFETILIPYPRSRITNLLFRRLITFAVTIALFVKYGRGQQIILWAEMATSGRVLLLYKKLFGSPLIVDIHGTTDESIQFSKNPKQNLERYTREVLHECNVLASSDGLVFVSNKMRQIYRGRYHRVLPDKQVVVPPMIEDKYEDWTAIQRFNLRRKLNLDQNAFIFVYAGGAHQWQCIDQILLFFENISRSESFRALNPQFVLLVWDVTFNLQEKIKELKISTDRIVHYSVKQREVVDYLIASDAGLIFRENLTTNLVAAPTKIPEYLLAGLPIICTEYIGDLPDIIKREKIGYIIKNINSENSSQTEHLFEWCSDIALNRNLIASKCQKAAVDYFGRNNQKHLKELVDPFL